MSVFAGHWALVQQWLGGQVTWDEMMQIVAGKMNWEDNYVHQLFRSASSSALAVLQKYQVPHFIGASGIEVSFSPFMVVFPLTCFDRIVGYVYDDEPVFLQYMLDTGVLDLADSRMVFK